MSFVAYFEASTAAREGLMRCKICVDIAHKMIKEERRKGREKLKIKIKIQRNILR